MIGHTAIGTWSGGRFMHFGEPLDTALARRELIVVGVISDPLVAANRKPNEPYRIYFPADTTWAQDMVFVRTASSATPLLPQIRSVAHGATDGAVIGLRTIAQDDAESERTTRAMAAGVMGAGAIAMVGATTAATLRRATASA